MRVTKTKFLTTALLATSALCLVTASAFAATDTVTNANASGAGSLAAVVAAASSGDTIVFSGLAADSTITLTSALAINKNLIINGAGATGLTVSGGNATNVFAIGTAGGSGGPTVTIENMTIANGESTGGNGTAASANAGGGGGGLGAGGGVLALGGSSVTVSNVTFSGNSATGGSGGAGAYSAGVGGTGGAGGGFNGGNGTGGAAGAIGSAGGNGTFGQGAGGAGSSASFGATAVGGTAGVGGGGGGSSGGDQFTGGGASGTEGGGGGYGTTGGGGGGGGGGAGLGGSVFADGTSSITLTNVTESASTVTGGSGGAAGTGSGGGGGGTAAGAALFMLNGATVSGGTIADSIGGTGGLSVTTATTTTLSGTNTYTGGTSIGSGATLSIGNDNNLGNTSGGVTFAGGTLSTSAAVTSARGVTLNTGGGTINTGTFNDTLSGVIGGTAGLTKTGSGKLTLSNAETYSGGTTISAGTLALGAGGSLAASGALGIASGATFDISGASGAQTIGDLSGAGAIALGAHGLTTTASGSDSYSGAISGTGGFTKAGSGTLALSGDNTYNGGTTISAGILSISNADNAGSGTLTLNGGTLMTTAAIADSAALSLGASGGTINTGTYSNTFSGGGSGAGALTKTGTGTLTLDGANAFSGTTTVSAGTLEVGDISDTSASLSGNVMVDAAATLRGHGTIGGNVTNGGTVAPGGTIGTLTVSGNYTQGSGDTLSIELNPTMTSKLAVSGTANIAGTLSLTPDAGSYTRGASYTILTSSGLTGTFGTIADTAPSVSQFAVSYTPDDVFITTTSGATAFRPNALTRDQSNLAGALDNVSANVSSGNFNTTLNAVSALAPSAQPQAFDQLDGHIATGLVSTSNTNLQALSSILQSRLGGSLSADSFMLMGDSGSSGEVKVADASGTTWGPGPSHDVDGGMSVWMQGMGEFATIGSNASAPGLTSSLGGGSFGFEFKPDDMDHVGVMFGAVTANLNVTDVAQSGTQDTYAVGLYGNHEWDQYVLDGSVLAGYNHATSQRQIALLSETANGTTDGYGIGLNGGIGYHISLDDDTTLTPRVGLAYTYNEENGYTETGAPDADLSVGGNSQSFLQSSLGATLATKFELDREDGVTDTFRPEIRLGWLHDWLNPVAQVGESFSGVSSTAFTAYNTNPGRDAADVGFGFSYAPGDVQALKLYARYDGTFSANETDSAVTAGVKYSW